MNGYGQQIDPNQYAQALQAFDVLQRRQDHTRDMARTGDPFALLGAALAGTVANKFGKYKDTSLAQAGTEIEQYQAQKQAELARIAEEKARREAQMKREQQLADEQAKRDFEMKKMMAGKRFDVENRAPQQPGFQERIFAQMSPEQRQAFINNMAGIKQGSNTPFTEEETALIQQRPELAEQIMQQKINKATGVKPDSVASQKKERAMADFKNSMASFRKLVKEHGTEYGGDKAARLKTAHTDLLLRGKDAYEMGALAGPDLDLMMSLINDPTALSAQFNPFKGGNIVSQVDQVADNFGWSFDDEEQLKTEQPKENKPITQQQNNTYFKYTKNQ